MPAGLITLVFLPTVIAGITWHNLGIGPEPNKEMEMAGDSGSILGPVQGQIAFSTYLGGSRGDSIRDIVTDRRGNIYITGGTASPDFPTTPGAYDRTFNGWHDAYVMKLAPNGNLVWSTFIGGPNYDYGIAIEVDDAGYVYITGGAGDGFPVTSGAFRTTFQGRDAGPAYGIQDGFVAKLKSDGSGLVFASYTGGRDLAIDQKGDIYIATAGPSGRFPSSWFTKGFQSTAQGLADNIVVKVKSDGSQVLWATYFGGSGTEGGTPSIRVDSRGSPYLLSGTSSTDLPTTPSAFGRTLKGPWDLFVAKFSQDGSNLVYATYLGGSDIEFTETHGLALDAQGNAYVAATTKSPDFPVTLGAFQRTYGGSGGSRTGQRTNYPGDAFVSKISADGSQLLASTFVGGSYGEGAEGIAVDAQGNVYISGATYSNNFPVTAEAFQQGNRGNGDFFAVKLSPDFSRMLYSTYLGGSSVDYGRTATIDSAGNFYVAGDTQSYNWPTRHTLQTSRIGDWDGALVKFTLGAGSSTRP